MLNDFCVVLIFGVTGIIIGFIFDLFRVSRKAIKTPNIITYIEDFLFWILSGLLIIYVQCVYADGQTRLYMILTLIIGTIIYFLTISKIFLTINTKIIQFFKKIFKK